MRKRNLRLVTAALSCHTQIERKGIFARKLSIGLKDSHEWLIKYFDAPFLLIKKDDVYIASPSNKGLNRQLDEVIDQELTTCWQGVDFTYLTHVQNLVEHSNLIANVAMSNRSRSEMQNIKSSSKLRSLSKARQKLLATVGITSDQDILEMNVEDVVLNIAINYQEKPFIQDSSSLNKLCAALKALQSNTFSQLVDSSIDFGGREMVRSIIERGGYLNMTPEYFNLVNMKYYSLTERAIDLDDYIAQHGPALFSLNTKRRNQFMNILDVEEYDFLVTMTPPELIWLLIERYQGAPFIKNDNTLFQIHNEIVQVQKTKSMYETAQVPSYDSNEYLTQIVENNKQGVLCPAYQQLIQERVKSAA